MIIIVEQKKKKIKQTDLIIDYLIRKTISINMKYMKLCIHNYLNIVAQKNVLKNMLKPEIEKIYNKVIISH